MLTFLGQHGGKLCDGLSRREFLRVGGLGLTGLTLADVLRLKAQTPQRQTDDKSIIIVYLNGGAAQLDMFDVKPKAPSEFRGEFKPIQTNVPGFLVSEHLPLHAKIADKYTIVQGMQTITSGHSLYEASSGFASGVVKRPAIGSIISRFDKRRDKSMPASVSMAYDAGPAYLGPKYASFSPNGGLMRDLYSNGGIPQNRVDLLRSLDNLRREIDAHEQLLATDEFTKKAIEMLASTKIREAFDVNKEPEKVRERYGKHTYGGVTLLQALRLAEAGVSCVTVYGPGNNKWDTHKNNFKTMKEQILPHYDKSIHAMITDLYDRGLDKKVLIAIYGEFGRTPRINKNAGRDHYPQSGFVQLAGGGLKMGQTIGDTGLRGDWDISRSKPYTIQNLFATFYHLLGIDPSIKIPDNFGRPQYILEQREKIEELF
ncbi:MAG: hypothetical protein KatS3mg105_0439 [Gemmatales bacterium]|nr:MAG: hypothetical protein KatS3mg105_0439 [Gemmatales bacterium]